MFQVPKPKLRSALRQKIGRRYFIVKRKLVWYLAGTRYSKIISSVDLPHSVIEHESFLLRPLKDVDMQLQHNKVTNLKLAAAHLNGIIIRPGETFSFWKLVGEPTANKGYLDGLVLKNGTITKGIGGGMCQLGNLIYWMALHTPLSITQRWRHSYDVFPDVNRSLPFGSGATLAYNYIDLQLTNNTEHTFQLKIWFDTTHLKGAILANQPMEFTYHIEERNHRFEQQYWGGYTRHNEIWRISRHLVTDLVSENLVAQNHALMMYNPLLPGN